jgi:hypothetical protein
VALRGLVSSSTRADNRAVTAAAAVLAGNQFSGRTRRDSEDISSSVSGLVCSQPCVNDCSHLRRGGGVPRGRGLRRWYHDYDFDIQ